MGRRERERAHEDGWHWQYAAASAVQCGSSIYSLATSRLASSMAPLHLLLAYPARLGGGKAELRYHDLLAQHLPALLVRNGGSSFA